MLFNIEVSNIWLNALALFFLVLFSDLIWTLISERLSLATGRIQVWGLDHIGQNSLSTLVFSALFQGFSFRKKSFFQQFGALVNVGSFHQKQTLAILMGALIGWPLSMALLLLSGLGSALVFLLVAAILFFFPRGQVRDLGVVSLSLGLFFLALFFCDLQLQQAVPASLPISLPVAMAVVIFASLFFHTGLPALLIIAFLMSFGDLEAVDIFILMTLHIGSSLVSFYRYTGLFVGRLRFAKIMTLVAQSLHAIFLFLLFGANQLAHFLPKSGDTFAETFQSIVVAFVIFNGAAFLLSALFFLGLDRLGVFAKIDSEPTKSQKIIVNREKHGVFSIHISLFLLRQEFKKFSTSTHTLFKMSRETRFENHEINQKFVRYQGIVKRVGSELKDLCFSIGRERCYRWHVAEVMTYYRLINRLELLVDDLAQVATLLRSPNVNADWERECRFWLGLQFKMFENFFQSILGVEELTSTRIFQIVEKSHEVLDPDFLAEAQKELEGVAASAFYRLTEGLQDLNRETQSVR